MIYTLLINSVAVFVTAYILDGVYIKNFFTAIGVAILLGLVNTFVRPILVFLTLPITVITFGLFLIVINALILMLVDALVGGFKIRSFGWAVLMSIMLSIVSTILFWIF